MRMPSYVAIFNLGAARDRLCPGRLERLHEHIQHQRQSAGVSFTSATAGRSGSAEAATSCACSGAGRTAAGARSHAVPNPSFKRTLKGRPLYTYPLFSAPSGLPLRSA
jgi:hypothetical protein